MSSQPLVVILSGGMDSSTLLAKLVAVQTAPIYVLTFDYGQRHSREILAADAVADYLKVPLDFRALIDVPQIFQGSALVDEDIDIPQDVEGQPQPVTYVPNRNMIFLSLAIGFAESRGAQVVYYRAHLEDSYGYWDCTAEFVAALNATLQLNRGKPVRIEAPFVELKKEELLQIGLDLKFPYELTWTCYEGGEIACGVCPTCDARLKAFAANEATDPLVYA